MLGALHTTEHFEYKRREPEQELLHQVLVEHLETFLERTRTEEFSLPRHVENELRDFVKCGVLAYGFVLIRCNDCGKSMAVGFSCKGRGFCPSFTGRRMADTSARLVDDVFPPNIPVKQWVLSLPIQIRYRLAYDSKLLSDVLAVFLRVVLDPRVETSPPIAADRIGLRLRLRKPRINEARFRCTVAPKCQLEVVFSNHLE